MDNLPNLLPRTYTQSFGTSHRGEITRHTVVGVIYDPSTSLYLCQFWEDYDGLTCLLSGGIEDGETISEALHREIKEETGYTDYKIIGQLGAAIDTVLQRYDFLRQQENAYQAFAKTNYQAAKSDIEDSTMSLLATDDSGQA